MKQTWQRVLAIALVTMLALAATGCGNTGSSPSQNVPVQSAAPAENTETPVTSAPEGETITFTISTDAAGIRDEIVDEIIQLLQEKSGGRIQPQKIAAGVLGSEREMAEAIQLNTLGMTMLSDMGIDIVVGQLGWAWLPGLITNYDEADKYYFNGWINEELTRMMAENGIIKIGNIENGFRVVGNVVKPITSMEDLKGMKIRVPEIPEVLRFYELAGALPVAIAGSEVLTALEQKTIDGLDNSVYNYTNQGVVDSVKYITNTNHCYSGGSIVVSEQLWNSLSDADKEIFKEVAKIAGDDHIKKFREGTQTLLDSGIASGSWEVVEEVSPEFNAAIQEVCSTIWEEFSSKYDAAVMEKVMSDFKN